MAQLYHSEQVIRRSHSVSRVAATTWRDDMRRPTCGSAIRGVGVSAPVRAPTAAAGSEGLPVSSLRRRRACGRGTLIRAGRYIVGARHDTLLTLLRVPNANSGRASVLHCSRRGRSAPSVVGFEPRSARQQVPGAVALVRLPVRCRMQRRRARCALPRRCCCARRRHGRTVRAQNVWEDRRKGECKSVCSAAGRRRPADNNLLVGCHRRRRPASSCA
jgi:hypothetical protein